MHTCVPVGVGPTEGRSDAMDSDPMEGRRPSVLERGQERGTWRHDEGAGGHHGKGASVLDDDNAPVLPP